MVNIRERAAQRLASAVLGPSRGQLQGRISNLEGQLDVLTTVLRQNGWSDFLSGFGDAEKDPLYRTSFKPNVHIRRREIEDLWQHHGVAASIIEVPAEDATRKKPALCTPEGNLVAVQNVLDEMPVKDGLHGRRQGVMVALSRALTLARATGGGALIISARDGRLPSEPLDVRNLESISRLHVHHAHELWPLTYNRDGSVETYQLAPDSDGSPQGKTFGVVHASRVWPFLGAYLTAQRAAVRRGWGEPVLQRVHAALMREGLVLDQSARTVTVKNSPYFKTEGLKGQVGRDGGKGLRQRLNIMAVARSILGVLPLDATEEVGNFDASLSGLPELLDRYPYQVCGAARMPHTKLYGMSPGGLNATGDSDIRLYYDGIQASLIALDVIPCLRWLATLIMMSHRSPTDGRVPDGFEIKPPTLWETTDQEQADTDLKQAQRDAIYLDRGVATPEAIAEQRGMTPAKVDLDKEDDDASAGGGRQSAQRWRAEEVQQVVVRQNGRHGDGHSMAVMIPYPWDLWVGATQVIDPHITLLYLPETTGRSHEVLTILRQVVAEHGKPERITTGRLEHMHSPDGKLVFFQGIRFGDWHLEDLRYRLVEAFQARGVRAGFPDHWLPHLTLSVSDDPRAQIECAPGESSWYVDALEVWGLDEVQTLPLVGV